MRYERRGCPRVRVNLSVRWEGVLTSQKATITSISDSGCFVLTGGRVEPKELIRLEIELPNDKEPVYLWSEVVDHAYDIGFAARFTAADDDDKFRLESYIQKELARIKR